MKSLVVAAVVSAYFFNGDDPQRMLETQYKSYITVQAFNKSGIEKYRNRILDPKKRLPNSARQFIETNIDWDVYAESIFRPNWDKLNNHQKIKFKRTLQRDAINRYGHLFSPDITFSVKFNGPTEFKLLKGNKFARVRTTISSLRNDAEIDVDFIFRFGTERWALCDVYIDGVSKTRSYRSSVRKIYKKKGFDGVIKSFRNNNKVRS